MLFIYGALPVGGIETFFVRMARERAKIGLPTAILLLSKPEASNNALLEEMKKYAQVLFPKDLFTAFPSFSKRFPLLAPIKNSTLEELFKSVEQIHVFDGMHALLGYRFTKILNKKIPITVGFYHYIKYLWGGESVAYFEKLNRKFIFNYLPQEALVMFSVGNRQLYERHKKIKFDNAQVFRLGVVDKKSIELKSDFYKPLRIAAVGRLVEFKSYNLYMLDVINDLKEKGYQIEFDIYGDGPLKQEIKDKISKLNLDDVVSLKGTLEYSEFDRTIAQYNLFIGSGTAIIQAASLGVVSIVGVENIIQAKTYGYFSDVHQYEYNLKGLDLPLFSVIDMIKGYQSLNEIERLSLRKKHIESIEEFTNESCQDHIDALKKIEMPNQAFKFNRWVYEFSRVTDIINMKINKKHPRLTQFDDFKMLRED